MKTLLASLVLLATSMVTEARLIQHWTDQALLEQSDLVVIATPTNSADTPESTDLPGLAAQKVIGVETKFAVSAVVKGDKALKNFVLHHYRADVERTGIVPNGPNLLAFKAGENRKFLLYLKREADGLFAPTVGQVDPGFQGISALSEPVSAETDPAPLADAAKPTPPGSPALNATDILAAGAWSEPVAGVPDKSTGRGAHRPILRGRLLLCESPKNHQPAVYLELQDCGDTWGGNKEIYADMSGFRLEFKDSNGQPLPPKPTAFSGGAPGAQWILLPCDSTIRLRVSRYASFSYQSNADYFISGSFVVADPPANHPGLDVWLGTLKLPAMKVAVPQRVPDTAPGTPSAKPPLPEEAKAILDGLNQKAADSAWQGTIDMIERPETRPPNMKDSGEATAFVSTSKRKLAELGVPITWNAGSKRYEVVAEANGDPIDRLVARLSAPNALGSWRNGTYPVLGLPETASTEQVLEKVFKMTGFDKGHVKHFSLLQSRNVRIDGGAYTAALVVTDLGAKIVLFTPGGAWSRVYDAGEIAVDMNQAAKAELVVRAKLISEDGDADKYARFQVRVLEVFKNPPGEKLADELTVAAYSGRPGVPDGESTLYLEHYNPQLNTGLWKLVGGEASSGVSHVTASAAPGQTDGPRPRTVDLGRVEMVDGSPSTFDLGGGRSCTITPTIGFSAVNSYDLVLRDGAAKTSAPRQTAVVGQPVHIPVGQIGVTFVPHVNSKP